MHPSIKPLCFQTHTFLEQSFLDISNKKNDIFDNNLGWPTLEPNGKKDGKEFNIRDMSPWQTTVPFLDFLWARRVPSEIYKHIHNEWEAGV